MVEAHFFKDSEGYIEATTITPIPGEVITTSQLPDSTWKQILSFPSSNREAISEFLRNHILPKFITQEVAGILQ